MGGRDFKDRLYAQFARIGQALANPHRLELLDLLAQGQRTVEALAAEADLSLASTSQHLQVLRGAQLVLARREGVRIFYRLADPAVLRLWQAVRDTGTRQLAEVDRIVHTYLADRQALEAISVSELTQRLADGSVLILDVRPALEYRQGHIAGAISLPVEELQARLQELPPNREVVAYCRGPYCVFSDEAVALLRSHGIPARRLSEGFPDWAAAGLPTAHESTPAA